MNLSSLFLKNLKISCKPILKFKGLNHSSYSLVYWGLDPQEFFDHFLTTSTTSCFSCADLPCMVGRWSYPLERRHIALSPACNSKFNHWNLFDDSWLFNVVCKVHTFVCTYFLRLIKRTIKKINPANPPINNTEYNPTYKAKSTNQSINILIGFMWTFFII